MTFGAWITAIFKFLPELISLIKWLGEIGENEIDKAKAKKVIKNINLAFKYADKIDEFDAQQTAGELDEIFTGIKLDDIQPHKLQRERANI